MTREECVENIMTQVRSTVESLLEESGEWRKGHWLFDAEHATQRAMMEIGRVALQCLVNRRGAGHVGQWHTDAKGERRVFKEYSTREVQTLVGRVRIRRASYQGSSVEAGTIQPLDEELGLRYEFSEGVEEVVAFTASQLTYKETAGVVEKTLGLELSETGVQEITNRWGRDATEKRVSAIPREAPSPRMAVATDGAMIRTAERKRKRKRSRKQHFEEHWNEVKLGVVYSFDRHGRGNSDKRYTASLKGKDAFGKSLWTQIEASGADRSKHVAWLGDGAEWNWTLKQEHLPHATEILDFEHAREHLAAVAEAVWGKNSPRAAEWVKSRKKRLLHGRVRSVIRELRAFARSIGPPPSKATPDNPNKIVSSNVTYFERNEPRMQYKHYRKLGYPIGSGVVESGCKHVIAQRMKITASMSWSETRAENLLQLRCLVRSSQWDRFWGLRRCAA